MSLGAKETAYGIIAEFVEHVRADRTGAAEGIAVLRALLQEGGVSLEEREAAKQALAAVEALGDPVKESLRTLVDELETAAEAMLVDSFDGGPMGHPTLVPPPAEDDADVVARTWQQVRQGMEVLAQHPLNARDEEPAVGRCFHRNQLYGGLAHFVPRTLHRSGLPLSVRRDLEVMLGTRERTVAARISKGLGCPFGDSVPDVIGIAVKLLNGNGPPVDILATNQPKGNHTRNTDEFRAFTETVIEFQTRIGEDPSLYARLGDQGAVDQGIATVGLAKFLAWKLLQGTYSPLRLGDVGARLARDTILHRAESVFTERYVSSTGVFHKGSGYHFRFWFLPSSTATAMDVDGPEHIRIRNELQEQVDAGVLLDLGIQLYTGNGTPSPADPSEVFDSRVVPIAALRLEHFGRSSAERAEIAERVNAMQFNPGQLGGLARLVSHSARKAVYEMAAKQRNAMSLGEAAALLEKWQLA